MSRATISDFDRSNISGILQQPERYTNYSAQLVRLIARADYWNREALREVYHDHVEAFETWERTGR